jgi:hypothetical protein
MSPVCPPRPGWMSTMLPCLLYAYVRSGDVRGAGVERQCRPAVVMSGRHGPIFLIKIGILTNSDLFDFPFGAEFHRPISILMNSATALSRRKF